MPLPRKIDAPARLGAELRQKERMVGMAVRLRTVRETATYLDPSRGFEPTTVEMEKRYDPLTGEVSLLVPFKRFHLAPVDWSDMVAAFPARKCPFCPENREEATPRFTPDFYPAGRMVYRDAVVIPNLSPYGKHSAVVIMSSRHYLAWEDLSREIIGDAFRAALLFLENCARAVSPGELYCSINWNYMPYSGGTLIHPHLQVLAGREPSNYHGRCLAGEKEYFRTYSSAFWNDLVETEKDSGARYIGQTGSLEWLSAFAPKALADLAVVFSGCRSLAEIGPEHVAGLAEGMVRIFPWYAGHNIPSFNFSLFITSRKKKGILVFGRLAGRFPLIPPAGSDMSYLQVLHDTPWTVLTPEDLAKGLRPLFQA